MAVPPRREAYIKPVYEPGKMTSSIPPPGKGIDGLPGECVYVGVAAAARGSAVS